MTLQKFAANDGQEDKMIEVFRLLLLESQADRDTMWLESYESFALGYARYDESRDPLVGVIPRDIYAQSYPAIHALFTAPGTFEFYLDVFRKVFSADADILFTIPGPGQLHLEISALTLEQFPILIREIVDGDYVYSNLVTSDTSEKIVAQGVSGIKTQAEVDNFLLEISANGIYTTAELITE